MVIWKEPRWPVILPMLLLNKCSMSINMSLTLGPLRYLWSIYRNYKQLFSPCYTLSPQRAKNQNPYFTHFTLLWRHLHYGIFGEFIESDRLLSQTKLQVVTAQFSGPNSTGQSQYLVVVFASEPDPTLFSARSGKWGGQVMNNFTEGGLGGLDGHKIHLKHFPARALSSERSWHQLPIDSKLFKLYYCFILLLCIGVVSNCF